MQKFALDSIWYLSSMAEHGEEYVFALVKLYSVPQINPHIFMVLIF